MSTSEAFYLIMQFVTMGLFFGTVVGMFVNFF